MDAIDAEILRREHSEDYNKFMQDMTNMILQVSVRLRGERLEFDSVKGQEVIRKVGDPLLNEIGLNYVESKLHSYLNPNLYMAKFKPADAMLNYRLEVISFGMTMLENKQAYQATTQNVRQVIGLCCPVFLHALLKSCSDKDFIEATSKTGYSNASADSQAGQQVQI